MTFTVFHWKDLFSPHLSRPVGTDIHIWILPSTSTDDLENDMEKLTEAERLRSGKFVQNADRLHYLIGHACLRKILGAYLALPAESLIFETGEHGKPYLSPDTPGEPIYFNLSHSGDQIALIFGNSPVGIDIQIIKSAENVMKLAKRYFHPEELSRFTELDSFGQTQLFFRNWSIREAFLKGLGTGLTHSTSSFCISPETADTFRITHSEQNYSDWILHTIPAPDGYVCSAAVKESEYTIT